MWRSWQESAEMENGDEEEEEEERGRRVFTLLVGAPELSDDKTKKKRSET